MNKKGQIMEMFEDMNPAAMVLAVIAAIISLVMISMVEINIIFKILTPVATFVVAYIVTSFQLKD